MVNHLYRVAAPSGRGGPVYLDQNLRQGEIVEDQPVIVWDPTIGDVRLSYADPRDTDYENGHLWLRHRNTFEGRQLWKAVNVTRTRWMMRERLCMVCSRSCVREDGRIWWLTNRPFDISPEGLPVTNLLPTCPDCAVVSMRRCPRLSAESHFVSVGVASPYAVTADIYMPGEDPPTAELAVHEAVIRYGDPRTAHLLRWALGKQPWVALHDVRDEDLPAA